MLFILTFYLSKNADFSFMLNALIGFHKSIREHNFIQFIFAVTGINI